MPFGQALGTLPGFQGDITANGVQGQRPLSINGGGAQMDILPGGEVNRTAAGDHTADLFAVALVMVVVGIPVKSVALANLQGVQVDIATCRELSHATADIMQLGSSEVDRTARISQQRARLVADVKPRYSVDALQAMGTGSSFIKS